MDRSSTGGSISIVHDGLHVVSREEPRGATHDALKPAVIVLLDDVDDRSFLEGQLVLFITRVIVDRHHWGEMTAELRQGRQVEGKHSMDSFIPL